MRAFPAGIAKKLQDLEDEEDDEVNHSIPTSWGVNHASDGFVSQHGSQWETLSISTSVATTQSARYSDFAPAFAPSRKKQDPYQSKIQQRAFSFAATAPSALEAADWDVIDPDNQKKQSYADQNPQSYGETTCNQTPSEGDFADVFEPKNQPLEGTFGADEVIRVMEENLNIPYGSHNSTALEDTAGRYHNSQNIDPRLENPSLDIDPNIKANFLPISRLHQAPKLQSEIARRNPMLIASNASCQISSVIGGQLVSYKPKPIDERLQYLDRDGKYVDDVDRGPIKKRLKIQHKEDVLERERQMLRATAEYRALTAMTPSARTALLESLRKPLVFVGAFQEDQQEVAEIPAIYIGNPVVNRSRVMGWMGQSSPLSGSPSQVSKSRVTEPLSTRQGSEGNGILVQGSLHDDADDGGEDDFVANTSYIPLASSLPRDNLYFADALYFGQMSSLRGNLQAARSSEAGKRTQVPTESASAYSQCQPKAPKSLTSSTGYHTNPGEIRSIYASYATSGGPDDPFTFDDTPEFQEPQDISIGLLKELEPHQERVYERATEIALKYGRVVLIRLHEPVIFSPSAIANRISGAAIQEMQLFPTQRLAIVVFVHPTEATCFLRHIKNTYQHGRAEEIRALQIDAGWYKDDQKQAILPPQPKIFRQLIAEKASRTLRLHRIPLHKTVGELSFELGSRLSKALLRVILCTPKQDYLKKRLGRQAVIEFLSVKEAIEAWMALTNGLADGYVDSEPVFTKDAREDPYPEKKWCKCNGCRSQREHKESVRALGVTITGAVEANESG